MLTYFYQNFKFVECVVFEKRANYEKKVLTGEHFLHSGRRIGQKCSPKCIDLAIQGNKALGLVSCSSVNEN